MHEAVYATFRDKLVAKVRSIVLGDPMDMATQMGPVVSERQMNNVLKLIGTAEPEGATILCGGCRSTAPQCAQVREQTQTYVCTSRCAHHYQYTRRWHEPALT